MATIVPAPQTSATTDTLATFLAMAVSWSLDSPKRSAADVLADDQLAHYVTEWGRDGDLAVLAYDDADGGDEDADPVGAAWIRRFSADDPGYGYVAATIPELAVAVSEQHQGEGIGTRLVQALLGMARLSGIEGVSLSVAQTNGAIVLYSRLGFAEIGVADGTSIMLKRF